MTHLLLSLLLSVLSKGDIKISTLQIENHQKSAHRKNTSVAKFFRNLATFLENVETFARDYKKKEILLL